MPECFPLLLFIPKSVPSVMAEDRLDWELAGGPEVGKEIPITGEPRRHDERGRPERSTPEVPADDGGVSEMREVRVADPALSDSANQRLTEEVRGVIGASRVTIPGDRPKPSQGERRQLTGTLAYLGTHRLLLAVTLAALLTIGAIISLATGNWWLLPLAAGVHAFGTLTIVTLAIRLTTISEHASPTTAALLEEEGIPNPDRHFSELVAEFSGTDQAGAEEVVSPGRNERTVPAGEAPATAAAEESAAMTPTAEPSEPAGEGGAPDVLIWSTALALLALSIFIPALGGGGRLWLLPAVMVPLLGGWMLIQHQMATPGTTGAGTRRRRLIVIAACTVLAVIAFCLVVALGFQH